MVISESVVCVRPGADEVFNLFFCNRGRVLAELFPIFYSIGTAPDNFAGRSGNAPIVVIALCTD